MEDKQLFKDRSKTSRKSIESARIESVFGPSRHRTNSEEQTVEVDVPADNSCFFWAIVLSYLIPVADEESEFNRRFEVLFGRLDLVSYVRKKLKKYDIEKPLYNEFVKDEKIKLLVCHDFRGRLVSYMAEDDIKEKLRPYHPAEIGRLEDYLNGMHETEAWAGDLEIYSVSLYLKCNVILKGCFSYPDPPNPDPIPTLTIINVNTQNRIHGQKNHYHFLLKASDLSRFKYWARNSPAIDDQHRLSHEQGKQVRPNKILKKSVLKKIINLSNKSDPVLPKASPKFESSKEDPIAVGNVSVVENTKLQKEREEKKKALFEKKDEIEKKINEIKGEIKIYKENFTLLLDDQDLEALASELNDELDYDIRLKGFIEGNYTANLWHEITIRINKSLNDYTAKDIPSRVIQLKDAKEKIKQMKGAVEEELICKQLVIEAKNREKQSFNDELVQKRSEILNICKDIESNAIALDEIRFKIEDNSKKQEQFDSQFRQKKALLESKKAECKAFSIFVASNTCSYDPQNIGDKELNCIKINGKNIIEDYTGTVCVAIVKASTGIVESCRCFIPHNDNEHHLLADFLKSYVEDMHILIASSVSPEFCKEKLFNIGLFNKILIENSTLFFKKLSIYFGRSLLGILHLPWILIRDQAIITQRSLDWDEAQKKIRATNFTCMTEKNASKFHAETMTCTLSIQCDKVEEEIRNINEKIKNKALLFESKLDCFKQECAKLDKSLKLKKTHIQILCDQKHLLEKDVKITYEKCQASIKDINVAKADCNNLERKISEYQRLISLLEDQIVMLEPKSAKRALFGVSHKENAEYSHVKIAGEDYKKGIGEDNRIDDRVETKNEKLSKILLDLKEKNVALQKYESQLSSIADTIKTLEEESIKLEKSFQDGYFKIGGDREFFKSENEKNQDAQKENTRVELELLLKDLIVVGFKTDSIHDIEKIMISVLQAVYSQYREYKLVDIDATFSSLSDAHKATAKRLASKVFANSNMRNLESDNPALIKEIIEVLNREYQSDHIIVSIDLHDNLLSLTPVSRIRERENEKISIQLYKNSNDYITLVKNSAFFDKDSIKYETAKRLARIFIYNDSNIVDDFIGRLYRIFVKSQEVRGVNSSGAASLLNFQIETECSLKSLDNFEDLQETFVKGILPDSENVSIIHEILKKLCKHVINPENALNQRQKYKLLSFFKKGFSQLIANFVQEELIQLRKIEETKIEAARNPLQNLEKLISVKFAKLKVLNEEITNKNNELGAEKETLNKLYGDLMNLEESHVSQQKNIRDDIEKTRSQDKILKEKLAAKNKEIEAVNSKMDQSLKSVIDIGQQKEALKSEKADVEGKLRHARHSERAHSKKMSELEVSIKEKENSLKHLEKSKHDEEQKLVQLIHEICYVIIVRFLISHYNNDSLHQYKPKIDRISDSSDSLAKRANDLENVLINDFGFTVLKNFNNPSSLVSTLVSNLGAAGMQLQDDLEPYLAMLPHKAQKPLNSLITDHMIFNQLLDVIRECVEMPQLTSSAINSCVEIIGFNINVSTVLRMLKDKVNNHLLILGVRINEKEQLSVNGTQPSCGFEDYPEGLREEVVNAIQKHYLPVEGEWSQIKASKHEVGEILEKIQLSYSVVLRAYFRDIVLIAGNNIYLTDLETLSLPGISLTLQADKNIYLNDKLTISTRGRDGREFGDTCKEAPSGSQGRLKINEQMKEVLKRLYQDDHSAEELKKIIEERSFRKEGWPTGKDGCDGLDGENGQNGGDICLRATRGIIHNKDKIKIITSGGNGSNGQSGGDGDEGIGGYDTPDADVNDTGSFDDRRLYVSFARKPGIGPNGEERKEELGQKGGKGGNAGLGGLGGLAGNIIIEDSSQLNVSRHENVENTEGNPGKEGEVGKGGSGGYSGRQGLDIQRYKPSFWDRTQHTRGIYDDAVLNDPIAYFGASNQPLLNFGWPPHSNPNYLGFRQYDACENYRGKLLMWSCPLLQPLRMIQTESEHWNSPLQRSNKKGQDGGKKSQHERARQQAANRGIGKRDDYKRYLNRTAGRLARSEVLEKCIQHSIAQADKNRFEIDQFISESQSTQSGLAAKMAEAASNQQLLNEAKSAVNQVESELNEVIKREKMADAELAKNHEQFLLSAERLKEHNDQLAAIRAEIYHNTLNINGLNELSTRLHARYIDLDRMLKQRLSSINVESQAKAIEIQKLMKELQDVEKEIGDLQDSLVKLKEQEHQAQNNKNELNDLINQSRNVRKKESSEHKQEVSLLIDHQSARNYTRFFDLHVPLNGYEPLEEESCTEEDFLFKAFESTTKEELYNVLLNYLARHYRPFIEEFKKEIRKYNETPETLANFLHFIFELKIKMAKKESNFKESFENEDNQQDEIETSKIESLKKIVAVLDTLFLNGCKKTFQKLFFIMNRTGKIEDYGSKIKNHLEKWTLSEITDLELSSLINIIEVLDKNEKIVEYTKAFQDSCEKWKNEIEKDVFKNHINKGILLIKMKILLLGLDKEKYTIYKNKIGKIVTYSDLKNFILSEIMTPALNKKETCFDDNAREGSQSRKDPEVINTQIGVPQVFKNIKAQLESNQLSGDVIWSKLVAMLNAQWKAMKKICQIEPEQVIEYLQSFRDLICNQTIISNFDRICEILHETSLVIEQLCVASLYNSLRIKDKANELAFKDKVKKSLAKRIGKRADDAKELYRFILIKLAFYLSLFDLVKPQGPDKNSQDEIKNQISYYLEFNAPMTHEGVISPSLKKLSDFILDHEVFNDYEILENFTRKLVLKIYDYYKKLTILPENKNDDESKEIKINEITQFMDKLFDVLYGLKSEKISTDTLSHSMVRTIAHCFETFVMMKATNIINNVKTNDLQIGESKSACIIYRELLTVFYQCDELNWIYEDLHNDINSKEKDNSIFKSSLYNKLYELLAQILAHTQLPAPLIIDIMYATNNLQNIRNNKLISYCLFILVDLNRLQMNSALHNSTLIESYVEYCEHLDDFEQFYKKYGYQFQEYVGEFADIFNDFENKMAGCFVYAVNNTSRFISKFREEFAADNNSITFLNLKEKELRLLSSSRLDIKRAFSYLARINAELNGLKSRALANLKQDEPKKPTAEALQSKTPRRYATGEHRIFGFFTTPTHRQDARHLGSSVGLGYSK